MMLYALSSCLCKCGELSTHCQKDPSEGVVIAFWAAAEVTILVCGILALLNHINLSINDTLTADVMAYVFTVAGSALLLFDLFVTSSLLWETPDVPDHSITTREEILRALPSNPQRSMR